ncbi:virulence-associated V antigen [Arsenophonus apicola]|uniref:Virulence-associated V antigen n=1 Tax=Arsenophonus apicola TaxID=2879119 RepID=A0ABY8P4A8_9GAMM|nr:virulence-associated V antigen [Arsenophonus apicola]WGO84330.1 virulence-associated V antigen [Arsenophonus apicola]
MATINGSSNNVTNQNYINNLFAPTTATPDINKITNAIINKLAQSGVRVELDQSVAGGKQTLDANIAADRDKLEQLFSQIFQLALPRNIKNLTDAENDIQDFMAKLDSQRQGASLVSANMLLTVIESYFSYANLDEDIIAVFAKNMVYHDDKRKELKTELEEISAEMKVYSVIQSEINSALSAASSQTINTDQNGINLMDYRLYGYSSAVEFQTKAEYKLLQKIAPSSTAVTIKQFLLSADKKSGAMGRVENSYKYDKDNNRLANFSTMVSDRSRPLSDSISEKTTRLNDISGRYNAAIEALNRFIQKYDSVIQDILRAI